MCGGGKGSKSTLWSLPLICPKVRLLAWRPEFSPHTKTSPPSAKNKFDRSLRQYALEVEKG